MLETAKVKVNELEPRWCCVATCIDVETEHNDSPPLVKPAEILACRWNRSILPASICSPNGWSRNCGQAWIHWYTCILFMRGLDVDQHDGSCLHPSIKRKADFLVPSSDRNVWQPIGDVKRCSRI